MAYRGVREGLQKMPSAKLVGLQERISDHMDAILRMFKPGAAITVVVRNPGFGDADVVLSSDDLDAVIGAIQALKTRPPTFKAGEPLPQGE